EIAKTILNHVITKNKSMQPNSGHNRDDSLQKVVAKRSGAPVLGWSPARKWIGFTKCQTRDSQDRPLELSVRYARFPVQILVLSELFEHEVCNVGTGNSSGEQPVSNVLPLQIRASSRSVGKG